MSGRADPDIPPGIVLERSGLGGLLVLREGVKLGWMHEHDGSWHAYLPMDGVSGQFLGKFSKAGAVRAIVANSPPGA